MSECVKNIIKTYCFILVIIYILLGRIDLRYVYCITLLLNSCMGISGFLVNISYSDLNKDTIYKYISMVFAFSGVINLVYGFSMLVYPKDIYYVNIITQMCFLAIGIEIFLLIYILNYKKTEINMNKVVNFATVFTIISLVILCRTSTLPSLFNDKSPSMLTYIIEIIYMLGVVYIIKNLKNIKGRISKRTLRDLQIYNIAKMIYLVIVFVVGIFRSYFKISNVYLFLVLLLISIVYSICIARICYMDIIKRPNQMLYRNLLKEKEKLEEANKAFKDYKNRYEEVLMHLPDGVIVYEDGVIVFSNEKINAYFNLSDNNYILGMTLEDLVDESERESIKDINDIKIPIKYSNLKYSFNDTEFYGEQTTIIKNKKNKLLSISIIKNMEDKIKLTKIKEELEYNKTMEEIKNQVLANISHDFKTPINVIYSTAQMQDLNINKKKYDSLIDFNQIVKQNCNRLIRLINNFIDSIKLESEILNANLKYVNIVSLVEDITTSVLTYAEDKNINLIFDTEEEEIYSSIDIDFMEKIMLNLLSNSIKYNKENGQIEVKVEETEQLIIILIKDTGVGIPKEKLKTVFERFERADRKSINMKEGSGIGLSIVKQMVEALNGKIDISSVENKGTVVKVILQKDNQAQSEIEVIDMKHLDEKIKLELSDI